MLTRRAKAGDERVREHTRRLVDDLTVAGVETADLFRPLRKPEPQHGHLMMTCGTSPATPIGPIKGLAWQLRLWPAESAIWAGSRLARCGMTFSQQSSAGRRRLAHAQMPVDRDYV